VLRLGVLSATAYLAGFLAREMARQVAVNDHLARHDALTGLPNRTLFHERLRQALEHDGAVGVILVDLDRFREVNNVLGHGHGDRLLQQVGPRLASVLRPNDVVARHGGDEFTVLLAESGGAPGVAETAQRLLRALHEPFVVDGISLAIEASIGAAVSPVHGRDPETLIGRADGAMYAAKTARSGYEFYVPDQDELSAERLGLLADIRRAIEQRELVVHYQPIVELASGRFAGVEALVRWQHPERGLLLPDEFIPLVEQTSLIRPLTLYVLEEALRVGGGLAGEIPVSVNLSMRALYDRGLSADVAVLLARAGFPAERLQLEITESALMENPVRSLDVLSELSRLGIRLTVDDFGTGYSSLAHLTQLPVDGVKIDKSFVLSMRESSSDTVIVRSVLNIGRNLGLEVVAEGVETAAACADLKALGCRLAQGFYFSEPLPPDDLTDWVAARAA
jgi:diguanylate cyclase (GGDEF)-like protein